MKQSKANKTARTGNASPTVIIRDLDNKMVHHAFLGRKKYMNPPHSVLDPNAGEGCLIKAMWRAGCTNLMWFCEDNPVRAAIVRDLSDDLCMMAYDFMDYDIYRKFKGYFDTVITYPPYINKKYIDQVYRMYDMCTPRFGRMVTVIPANLNPRNKKESTLMRWLVSVKATVIKIKTEYYNPESIELSMIVIDKK